MAATFAEPIRVLLVEDNPIDAKVARSAMTAAGFIVDLRWADNGEAALSMLRDADAGRFVPDVILLDLSIPKLRGTEVMRELADDPVLAEIPIVIMTGSEDRDDVLLEARHRVRSYLRKPLDLRKLTAVIRDIENRVRLNRLRSAGGQRMPARDAPAARPGAHADLLASSAPAAPAGPEAPA